MSETYLPRLARALSRRSDTNLGFVPSGGVSPIISVDPLPDELKIFAGEVIGSCVVDCPPVALNVTYASILNRPASGFILILEDIRVSTDIAGIIDLLWNNTLFGAQTPNAGYRDSRSQTSLPLSAPFLVGPGNINPYPASFAMLDSVQVPAGLITYQSFLGPWVVLPNSDLQGVVTNPFSLAVVHRTVTTPTLKVRIKYRLRPLELTEYVP